MTLGTVRGLRRESSRKVAKVLGVSIFHYQEIELGRRPLSEDEVRLARRLDTSGVLVGITNWLRWLYHERRPFEDLDRARPALEPLAKTIVHVGPLGAGSVLKLAVNTVIFGLNEALADCPYS